jgi:hypothetical protein
MKSKDAHKLTRTKAIVVTVVLAATTLLLTSASAKAELQTVKAGNLSLQVPANWKQMKTTSQFRLAQFQIPGDAADDEPAELVVYYFGGGATGGVAANVQRWVDQFQPQGRKVDVSQGKSENGEYVLANISGTWKKPDGPPFAQKTIDKPGSRVIGVVLTLPMGDQQEYFFLKLAGSDALVQSQLEALRTAFAAKVTTETPFPLEGITK